MEPRLEVAEVFRRYEQEFLVRWGDTLSSHQRKAFRDICACRTAALGARLQQCDHCSHQDLVFKSCRNRACPKCQSAAREKWLATTAHELLPVPYSHVTFTLPHQLCLLALQNPRLVYGMLFQAASQTLLTLAADPRRIGAQIGFLAVLHTWDQQMRPHPHLHCLVPAGGIAPDQSRWIRTRHPRFFLPGKVLAKMFRGKFLALLRRAYRRNKLRLGGLLAAWKKPAVFDRLYRQLQRLNWVVDARAPFGNPPACPPIPGSLYTPGGHLQRPPTPGARGPSDLPLEGLSRREPTKTQDAGCHRVHPPVPASHPAARLRQDSPFRLPGAPPPAFRTPAGPEAIACARVSPSVARCTARSQGTSLPPLWPRNASVSSDGFPPEPLSIRRCPSRSSWIHRDSQDELLAPP